jgi:hypothetical protein
MACQANEQGALSERLKTLLDPGKDKFPYVIGITTEEEYYREIYVNNPAFARRFKRIAIENTDDLETLKILRNALIQQAPKALLDPEILPGLLQKTKNAFGEYASQPAACLRILSQCIKRIAPMQASPLEVRVEEMRGRIQSLYAQGAGLLPYGRTYNAAQLGEKLQTLEVELVAEKEKLAELLNNQNRLAEIKKEILKKVVRTENYTFKTLSVAEKRTLNAFSLQSHFQVPALESRIRQNADALHIKASIGSPLIDEVIAEELDNHNRLQEAIGRGKSNVAARKS